MLRKLKRKILHYLFAHFGAYLVDKENIKKKLVLSKFKKIGKNASIGNDYTILLPQYIEIGDSFTALDRLRMEAFDKYKDQSFTPKIKIGNNVTFNTDVHIGCTNLIEIGDNCLFASRIYITDHHHGDTSDGMISLSPIKRPLVSKGPVIIEKNVWIGEGVAIMPGVTIGANCIIATNAVVTKNIPKNSVAAGIPAKVIKTLK